MTETITEYRAWMAPPSEIRVSEDGGTFEGYALLWNVVDSYGTQFAGGSIAHDTSPYAALWMHDPFTVVGQFTARKDSTGLWITGAYDQTRDGQDARARAKSGSARELSIGFQRTAVSPEDPNIITGANLVEVSQITARMAAVPGAALASVRAQERIRAGVGTLDASVELAEGTEARTGLVARLRLAQRDRG